MKEAEAKNIPATIKSGENFTPPITFYVEGAKGNVIPAHFTKEENKDRVKATVNGVKTTIYRSVERSAYCAFCLPDPENGKDAVKCYYVRDHSFADEDNVKYVTYVKPVKEAPPKKEKAVKAEDIVPAAKKVYEVTDVKAGEATTMKGKDFIAKFGLEKATAILNGRRSKTFTADEYSGEAQDIETLEEADSETDAGTGAV
ncbi:MAG: hypothetical protein WBP82_09880 [Leuconostoc mesenteroides]